MNNFINRGGDKLHLRTGKLVALPKIYRKCYTVARR